MFDNSCFTLYYTISKNIISVLPYIVCSNFNAVIKKQIIKIIMQHKQFFTHNKNTDGILIISRSLLFNILEYELVQAIRACLKFLRKNS